MQIGVSEGRPVKIDLPKLADSRMLIQGNSVRTVGLIKGGKTDLQASEDLF